MSGKAGLDPTSAECSVDYNILTGKMPHARSAENVDSLGNTMLGVEVKERFHSMRDAFLKMDSNRDGRIAANEIRSLCRQWNIPLSEAERVLEAADLDANGTMDFNEFAKRFDPDYGYAVDGDPLPMASSMAYGSVYDDRPIASTGWANFDDMDYSDAQVGAATKIQATARGRIARKDVTANRSCRTGGGSASRARVRELGPGTDALDSPQATPAGSGSRAARSISSELASENAALQARVRELEEENASLREALAASQEREAQLSAQLAEGACMQRMERTQSPVESAGLGSTRGGGGRAGGGGRTRSASVHFEDDVEVRQEPQAVGEEPQADVVVYGRSECKKTKAVMSDLAKAGVAFDAFDFDKTKEYMTVLQANGCSGKVGPPVVVCFGKHAFWDEPDAAIAVHFPSLVVNELRKLGLVRSGGIDEGQPVMRNVSIDVEIAERFHNMQDAFLKMDDNKDGRVSKNELRSMCRNWNIPQSEAERIIREADFDANGTLDFREFARRFGR